MSSKWFSLWFVFLAGCSSNRIEINPQPIFSSTYDAGVRTCPLAAIDSLAPCRVTTLPGPAGVRVNGDTVTFAIEAPAARVVRLSGGIELPLERVGNSDVFAASVVVPRADRAIISYRIFTDTTRGNPARFEFRGDNSGARPARARKLRGSLRFDTLCAPSLRERREIISYMPFGPSSQMPVLYVPDAGMVKQLALLVDTLIADGKLEPIVLVGMRASPEFRANEYVWGFQNDSTRFFAHERFFIERVIPWAEKTLPVTRERSGRMIWGTSNGGAFAIAMGLRHPDLFERVFAASPVFELIPKPRSTRLPSFHLMAGTFEGTSHDRTAGLALVLRDLQAAATFDETVAGHDEVAWLEWLVRTLVNSQS